MDDPYGWKTAQSSTCLFTSREKFRVPRYTPVYFGGGGWLEADCCTFFITFHSNVNSSLSLSLSLKAVLSVSPAGTVDLSGLPLSRRDAERLVLHLQRNSARVRSVELGFTELTDDTLMMLLPTLSALPALESLALNGNRLTRGVLRQLTDALKDPRSFPALAWVDLGNNVDIFSLPQAFLLSLRKRCPKQGNLPTIQEQPEQGSGVCGTAGLEEAEEDPD